MSANEEIDREGTLIAQESEQGLSVVFECVLEPRSMRFHQDLKYEQAKNRKQTHCNRCPAAFDSRSHHF